MGPVELISMDNALYVVECGCTNDWLTRSDCPTGKPITLLDLGLSEEKCENCSLHPWVILPLSHPVVVELDQIQDEIIDLFKNIAEVEGVDEELLERAGGVLL